MKTITRKNTNESIYLFSDTTDVFVSDEKTIVGNPVELIINDCNASNTNVYTNVQEPADWQGWKYTYTSEEGWQLNPNFVE